MKKQQKQLATIQSTSTVVVPKPTKGEVIAALVEVARREHAAEVEANDKAKQDSERAYRSFLKEHLATHPELVESLVESADLDTWSSGVTILRISGDTKDLALGSAGKTLFDRWQKMDDVRIRSFDEKDTRRKITHKLAGMEDVSVRIEKLAASPEVAALYAAISK